MLDDLLTRLHDLQARIYPPFYPLFSNHLSQVYRAFEPGLHVLTWSSLNIDAYIAKVHRALDRFETSISNINVLIAEKIDHILDNELLNSSCLLFSIDYICSKIWSPAEFLENMRSHLSEQSIEIGKKLRQIQRTFQEVEDMLKLNSTGQKSRSSTSSTRRTKASTPATNETMLTFIRYYQNKMISCVQKLIERTLLTFIDLTSVTETKYLIDQTKLIRFLFEGQNPDEQINNTDTHRIRHVHFILISIKEKFLVFSYEYRIGCALQYAIPEIIINPQLMFCQKCICDVANAIIGCEKQISGMNIVRHDSVKRSIEFLFALHLVFT